MEPNTETIDPSSYFFYAGHSATAWNDIVGQRVTNVKFGRGTVLKADPCPDDVPIVWVRFDRPVDGKSDRRFLTTSFRDNRFSDLTLPPELIQKVQAHEERRREEERKARLREEKEMKQAELAAEAREEFRRLKAKYEVAQYTAESPLSRLHKVLLSLEEDGSLDSEDVSWLERENLAPVLAAFYEEEYKKTGDPWHLVKASSKWQDAHAFHRALQLTDDITATDSKLMGAILTTRGRAYRNILELDTAEDCARKAIGLNPSARYPYNLLGAIYYQRGSPEEGDAWFAEALKLGATREQMDRQIRSSLKQATEVERRRMAQYLLRKDPKRYHWARHYTKAADRAS